MGIVISIFLRLIQLWSSSIDRKVVRIIRETLYIYLKSKFAKGWFRIRYSSEGKILIAIDILLDSAN